MASGLRFPEGPVSLRRRQRRRRRDRGRGTSPASRPTARSSPSALRAEARTAPRSGPMARSTSATTVASSGTTSTASSPGPQPDDYIGGRIQRVDLDTGAVEDLYTECDGIRSEARTTSCSTPPAASASPTSASPAPATWSRRALLRHADGTTIRGRLRPRPRQRRRPVARRQAALRRRDDDRAAVVLGHRLARRAQAGHRVRARGRCCTPSTATSCSTRWGSTATATSASPRSSPAPSRRSRRTASSSTSTVPEYDPFVTNVCFGGDGYRTAYVTSSGRGLLYNMDAAAPPATPLNYEI